MSKLKVLRLTNALNTTPKEAETFFSLRENQNTVVKILSKMIANNHIKGDDLSELETRISSSCSLITQDYFYEKSVFLPDVILMQVFDSLCSRDLCKGMCVSRQWFRLITSSNWTRLDINAFIFKSIKKIIRGLYAVHTMHIDNTFPKFVSPFNNLATLTLTRLSLNDINLDYFPNLVRLKLFNVFGSFVIRNMTKYNNRNLKNIQIHNCLKIGFINFDNLEELSITNSNLQNTQTLLTNNKNTLTTMYLDNIVYSMLVGLKLPNIKSLYTSLDIRIIDNLCNIKKLVRLSCELSNTADLHLLENSQLIFLNISIFKQDELIIPFIPKLETLTIYSESDSLELIGECKSLTDLNIRICGTIDAINFISPLLKNLTIAPEEDGVKSMRHIFVNMNFDQLCNLKSFKSSEYCIEIMERLSKFKCMKKLVLQKATNFTPPPNLAELHLGKKPDVQTLMKILSLDNLQYLNIEGNKVCV